MSSPNSLPIPSSDCTVTTEKSQVRPPKLLAKGFLFARLHPRQPSALPGTAQISGAAQDSSLANSQIPVPPLFPADRNATSTRILLQDTKATMEGCSARLSQLVTGVEQTMVEAKLIGKALETSHDNVVAETVDVVNRCQKTITKSIDTQNIDIKELDRKLDRLLTSQDNLAALHQAHGQSLQSLTQLYHTHSQALNTLTSLYQTQTHALQNIQQQQHQIIAALAPLGPLIQSLPTHVDAAVHKLSQQFAESQRPPVAIRTRELEAVDSVVPPEKKRRRDPAEADVPRPPAPRRLPTNTPEPVGQDPEAVTHRGPVTSFSRQPTRLTSRSSRHAFSDRRDGSISSHTLSFGAPNSLGLSRVPTLPVISQHADDHRASSRTAVTQDHGPKLGSLKSNDTAADTRLTDPSGSSVYVNDPSRSSHFTNPFACASTVISAPSKDPEIVTAVAGPEGKVDGTHLADNQTRSLQSLHEPPPIPHTSGNKVPGGLIETPQTGKSVQAVRPSFVHTPKRTIEIDIDVDNGEFSDIDFLYDCMLVGEGGT